MSVVIVSNSNGRESFHQDERLRDLDGTVVEDDLGTAWRVTNSDRPDVDFLMQYRAPDASTWIDRYVFTDQPRSMGYFAATCEYLTAAPESIFTGSPTVTIATDTGHVSLSGRELTRVADGERTVRDLDRAAWDETLADTFGLQW